MQQPITTWRREFALPSDDREFLDERGLPWETLSDGCGRWLLIHDVPLPVGYTDAKVSVALMIPASYPDSALDMAYFSPALALTSRKTIVCGNAFQMIDSKSWQRWSRHRTGQNAWRPGVDCISTHLALVESWLEKEPTR